MTTPTEFDTATSHALLSVCLFAAFADGHLDDTERATIQQLAGEIGESCSGQIAELTREVLMGRRSWDAITPALQELRHRLLAYEMARLICEANGALAPEEQDFLRELQNKLELPAGAGASFSGQLAPVASPPEGSAAASPEQKVSNEERIMRAAIINGALEILPGPLATMAILPLQMKLVHDIAKSHGIQLGTANIKDFLATLGVGLASQVFEGFARKLLGGIGKSVAGKLGRGLGSQAAGSAMSFASTYAIGHVADRYYAGGQKLSLGEIKPLMDKLTRQAQEIYSSKLPEIQQSAKTLNPAALLDMVRGQSPA